MIYLNYLKIAMRSLARDWLYNLLNIFGLTIGLTAGILILLWVEDEVSYDAFHRNTQDIYWVTSKIQSAGAVQEFLFSPPAVAFYGKDRESDVINSLRVSDNDRYSLYKGGTRELSAIRSAFVDSSFFTVFDFQIITGNPHHPFPNKNSVIITQTTASKYFGNEDPIGKTIVADGKDTYVICGLIKDFPENSSIKYDMLFPFDILEKDYINAAVPQSINDDWGNYSCNTFIQLKPGGNPEKVGKSLTEMLHQHLKNDQGVSYKLLPLSQVHLHGSDGSNSGMQLVRTFSLVALLLLAISCINYVNLSTAKSILRVKEVSIRKIIGATKMQIFARFLSESALVFFYAACLSLLAIYLLFPLYNSISGKELKFNPLNKDIWLPIVSTILTCLIVSGVYPALIMSSFKPTEALKGGRISGVTKAGSRKILVTIQLICSIALLAGTFAINKQLNYLRNKQLGFDKSNVLSFWMRDIRDHYASVKSELSGRQGIEGVAAVDGDFINSGAGTGDIYWPGKKTNSLLLTTQFGIDKDFIPLLKLQLLQGRNFTGANVDSLNYILNETAIKEMGITNPVGSEFGLHGVKGRIIGVVKDFHFRSLAETIPPIVFFYTSAGRNMFIRTMPGDQQSLIRSIEEVWKRYNPSIPFEYSFVDEQYDSLYKSDKRLGTLFNIFAIIAIFVSCLGLFGLAAFSVQSRLKEVSIRRALGASGSDMFLFLNKEIFVMVLIAFLVAAPISWIFIQKWLQNFAYHIDLRIWVLTFAGMAELLIAIGTTSFHSIKAAMVNPVKYLRKN